MIRNIRVPTNTEVELFRQTTVKKAVAPIYEMLREFYGNKLPK